MDSPTRLRRSDRIRAAPMFYSPPPPLSRKSTGNNKNVSHRDSKQRRRRQQQQQLGGGQALVKHQPAAAATATEIGAANTEIQNRRNPETSNSIYHGRKRRAGHDDIQDASSHGAAAHGDGNRRLLKRRIVETTSGAIHGSEEISPESEGERKTFRSSHPTDQIEALSQSSPARPSHEPVDAILRGSEYHTPEVSRPLSRQQPYHHNQDLEDVSGAVTVFPSIEGPLTTPNSASPDWTPQRSRYQRCNESQGDTWETNVDLYSASMLQETYATDSQSTPRSIPLPPEQRWESKRRVSSRHSPDNVSLPPRGIDDLALQTAPMWPSARPNGIQEHVPPVSELSTILESEVTPEWQRPRPPPDDSESRQSDRAEVTEASHAPACPSGGSNMENVKTLERRLDNHQGQLQDIGERIKKIEAQPQGLEQLEFRIAGVLALANLSHTAVQKHTNQLSDLKQRLSVLERRLAKPPGIDTRIMIRLKELQAIHGQDARFTALEKDFYDHFGVHYKHLGNATVLPPEVSGAWYLRAQAHLRRDQDTQAQYDADEVIIRDAEVITSTWLASSTSYVNGNQAQAFAELFAKACEREAMEVSSFS